MITCDIKNNFLFINKMSEENLNESTGTETKIDIDTTKSSDSEDYLTADFKNEIDAIIEMNFEEACELTQRKYQYYDDETENEKAHYEEQAQILEQQNFEEYNNEITRISQDYLQTAEHYKNLWQEYCKTLVARHREEASNLEQQWREAREVQIDKSKEQAEASFGTARILAMCEMYDEAIKIRDAANNVITDNNSPELQKIDIDFTARFQYMTKRHFAEYQYLHRHLKALMKTLRERANAQKKTAEATLQVEQAQNSSLILETVIKEGVSMKAKESLIQSFSPRSKSRQRPFSKARSYAINSSPIGLLSRGSSSLAYSHGNLTPRPRRK